MSLRNGNITGSTGEGGARGGDTRSAQQRVRRNTINPASSTPPLAQPPWNQTHQYHHPTPQQAFPAAVSHIAPQNRQPLQQSFRQQPLHSQLQLPISERSLAIDGFYACCFQEINRFAYGRTLSQESRRRLNLLTEAVSTQDGAYLALHHFYCLSRVDINSIPLDLRTQEFFQTAISLLDKVLSSNNHLSNEVLHFFTNFPMRINTIMEKWPPGFTLERTPLITFITKSAGFGCFQDECHRRRFPPVMRELFDDLGIHSWTLQRVVFDHIAGHLLGILPSPQYRQTPFNYRSQAIQEFIASQHAFYERIKTRPDDDDGSDRAIEKDHWSRLWAHFGEEMKQHRLTPDSLPRPSRQSINTQSDLGVIRQSQEYDTPLTRHGQAPYNSRRLLPPPGWQLPPMHKPMPWCSALHQAGLRSPDLRANKNVKLGGYPLYQYVSGFARAPARLADTVGGVEKWTFTVTPSQWQSLPKDVPGLAGAPATRFLDDTKQVLRLRCIKWAEDELPNDHEWAVADTLWIPYSYFTLNGTSLEQRKKIHYGRDLPIDLTSLLKKGDNRLDIAVMRTSDDESYLDYLVAIEIVATTTHAAIRESCLSRNYISYSRRIEEIKQQLSASSGDDDDDIVVLESGCSIDLIDPLSMFKVCDIPVRGTACTHYECFDLDTFLKTRKRKRDGDATKPDRWQCPVCKQDARPQHLMVDGFLDAVRDELARNGLLDNTKSITVASDGTWEPKVEDNGITDRSDVDIEVIDLSD